jgi:hypothetical protein
MRNLLIASAVCGLTITIIPPLLCFGGMLDLPMSQQLMTLGMILWFTGDVLRVIGRRKRQ